MTLVLSFSPALLFFSLSHLLVVTGAAAVSAAAQNILLTTRNEAILTEFSHLHGHLHTEETFCMSRRQLTWSQNGAQKVNRF